MLMVQNVLCKLHPEPGETGRGDESINHIMLFDAQVCAYSET